MGRLIGFGSIQELNRDTEKSIINFFKFLNSGNPKYSIEWKQAIFGAISSAQDEKQMIKILHQQPSKIFLCTVWNNYHPK